VLIFAHNPTIYLFLRSRLQGESMNPRQLCVIIGYAVGIAACSPSQDSGAGAPQSQSSAAQTDATGSGNALKSPTDANTIIAPAAPKTTPTGASIGTAVPGVSTGFDPNGTVKPPITGSPNAITNPKPTEPVANPNSPKTSPTAPTGAYTPVAWPNIGFNDYSGSLGKKVVALTFDDGPDGTGTGENNTAAVLDFLKANNIKASFFVCGSVWTLVTSDSEAQADMKRIIAEGHDIGSHTFSHPHLDTVSASEIQDQFAKNLAMAKQVLGPQFGFSMYRAPFGFPFQANNPNVAWVAPAVASNGVHVGWGIDTDDWKCAQNGQSGACILNNLKAQLDAGHSGPILMHSVYKLTVDTLPDIVALLKSCGYTFSTVQEMIRDKYGATSGAIQSANAARGFSYGEISSHAEKECANNQYIDVPY
jgi:peptidoglycan/xylan/chitin deacetylase (PgdA/CDA1 family)